MKTNLDFPHLQVHDFRKSRTLRYWILPLRKIRRLFLPNLTLAAAVSIIVAVVLLLSSVSGSESADISFAEEDIVYRGEMAGVDGLYVIADGNLYRELKKGGYEFVVEYYDPDFLIENYRFEGDDVYRIDTSESSIKILMRNDFSDDFESYSTIFDLMLTETNIRPAARQEGEFTLYDTAALPTRWTTMTLQSPKSSEVADYVNLRHEILYEGGDFLENRIDPTRDRARGGSAAVRFEAVRPSRSMVTSKASISSDTFHFTKGDDFHFEGWFYLEEGVPTTIMDLESTWLLGHSGIRILFSESGHPYAELKGLDKPSWRNTDVVIPQNEWVRIRFHTYLDDEAGTVRLWMNDVLVIEGTGRTLVLPDTVLDSLEIGISATSMDTVLYVDDVVVSGHPIP